MQQTARRKFLVLANWGFLEPCQSCQPSDKLALISQPAFEQEDHSKHGRVNFNRQQLQIQNVTTQDPETQPKTVAASSTRIGGPDIATVAVESFSSRPSHVYSRVIKASLYRSYPHQARSWSHQETEFLGQVTSKRMACQPPANGMDRKQGSDWTK